jgi:formylglycine-generating enzyme required for sulfatase activity
VAQWRRQVPPALEPMPQPLDPDPVARLVDPDRFRGDQRPVVDVSWHEANEFCRRLRQRTGRPYALPSEAQWEYACRAGTTTPFAFGETINTALANYNAEKAREDGPRGKHRQQTTDVASFPANAWGLHDMHGNVGEWCADHWHGSYRGAPDDGRPWVEAKPGEQGGSGRLVRGGSWHDGPLECRSAYRCGFPPVIRDNLITSGNTPLGFRVCCLSQNWSLNTEAP